MGGQGVMDASTAAALASASLSFVSKGETGADGEVKDAFVAASAFDGFKSGYVFKMGSKGLGYYQDHGGMGPFDAFDVNAGTVVSDAGYDMDKHIRGEQRVVDDGECREKQPGEGRVGALGDLLAENRNKKQEEIDNKIHDNRFCPPKALDEDETDFLAEKAKERKAAEEKRKQEDYDAAVEFRVAQAAQEESDKPADITRLLGMHKAKADTGSKQNSLLSRLVKRKVLPTKACGLSALSVSCCFWVGLWCQQLTQDECRRRHQAQTACLRKLSRRRT